MDILTLNLSEKNASIQLYLRGNVAQDVKTLPAIIICPGGGYEFLSTRESEPLALAFSAQGYQVIILNYPTIKNYKKLSSVYLEKNAYLLGEVFSLINENQIEWCINTGAVFLLGCSAGGHLATLYVNQWQKYATFNAMLPLGNILCYPVIGFNYGWPETPLDNKDIYDKFDTTTLVNQNTPDTFLWHTVNDNTVPVLNTLKYCESLAKNDINFECHLFENGRHGLGLATRSSAKFHSDQYINPYIADWFNKCIHWMEEKLNN